MANIACKTTAHDTRGASEVSCPSSQAGWQAELDLWFERSAGKTRLVRRRHLGPLMVQSPFHPERDGTCHVYLLHPPGGVAGGDKLAISIHLGAGACALLTTPGATKFYRSRARTSHQAVTLDVGPDAICEYFPQETILFDGAQAIAETQVNLAGSASYAGWDFFCLGRPAANERFDSGRLQQRIAITRDARPIWFERCSLAGGSHLLDAAHAFAGHSVWGTFVYAGASHEGSVDAVRSTVGTQTAQRFSVSGLEDIVVCRYLGPQAAEGKTLFAKAWGALRQLNQGKAAVTPRIWAT